MPHNKKNSQTVKRKVHEKLGYYLWLS